MMYANIEEKMVFRHFDIFSYETMQPEIFLVTGFNILDN